jgi:hypothetical protein
MKRLKKTRRRHRTSGRPNHTRWHAEVAERLTLAADWKPFADVAGRTGFHAETVRRYLRTGRFPVQFLAAFCRAYEVEPRWMLFGEGPMNTRAAGRRRSP